MTAIAQAVQRFRFPAMKFGTWDSWLIGILCAIFMALVWQEVLPFTNVESAGFVTGALAVWLNAKNNWWGWPWGIVNGIFYVVIFYDARFFADMTLQFVFITMGVMGIYTWLWGGKDKTPLPITNIGWKTLAGSLTFWAAGTVAMHEILVSVNGAAPWFDASLVAGSLVAQYLLVKRIYQTWFVWIALDVFYIYLFFTRDLPLTGILYIIFMSMCVYGLFFWTRERKAVK